MGLIQLFDNRFGRVGKIRLRAGQEVGFLRCWWLRLIEGVLEMISDFRLLWVFLV